MNHSLKIHCVLYVMCYSYVMDIWKHGKYIDLWSVVHFLSGFLLASICYILGYTLIFSFICSVLLLILWEVFEWLINIIEPSLNAITDIVVGSVGFLVGAWLLYGLHQQPQFYVYPVILIAGGLALWGFIDFKKRGYR